jgi:starvation-inducible DNA-binding protein
MAAAVSRLPEYPSDLPGGLQHVRSLADRYASFAATTRAGITTATEAGDLATADLLSDICRGLDKHLWFLEAHLQEG